MLLIKIEGREAWRQWLQSFGAREPGTLQIGITRGFARESLSFRKMEIFGADLGNSTD